MNTFHALLRWKRRERESHKSTLERATLFASCSLASVFLGVLIDQAGQRGGVIQMAVSKGDEWSLVKQVGGKYRHP